MQKEIALLRIYAKMGIALPKKSFVQSFKKVIRFGTSEEIESAYNILIDLSKDEATEKFALKGIDVYKDMMKSRLSFMILKSKIGEFKQTNEDILMIKFRYDRIKDHVFLRQANSIIEPFLEANPIMRNFITIRKTQKEVEEAQVQSNGKIEQYKTEFNEFLERFKPYIIKGIYSDEHNNIFQNQLRVLELKLEAHKEEFGNDYGNFKATLTNSQDQLHQIIESLHLEQQLWQY